MYIYLRFPIRSTMYAYFFSSPHVAEDTTPPGSIFKARLLCSKMVTRLKMAALERSGLELSENVSVDGILFVRGKIEL